MSLQGKKLLILGANPETVPLVQYANEMGVKTLVTSNCATDEAKKYAWKSCEVDGLDVDGLVELATKESVDGVLVGVADILINPYQQVCERMGFPCYASKKSVDVLTQKGNFKRTCEKYGIMGIPEYRVPENAKEEDLEDIKYPVLVKPVDCSSGVGMTICYNYDELMLGIQKAIKHSKKREYLVERYMTCDDMFVYYTFKDGKCELSAIADRFTTKEQGNASPVCLGAMYPSKYRELYFDTMHSNACKMFNDLEIKNGVLLIQGFVEDGQIYVYDPGFRLQGEAPHLLINAINGFDHRRLLIEYALTGKMQSVDMNTQNDSNFCGKVAGSLWILLKAGKIGEIKGVKELENDPAIVHVVQRMTVGDVVTESMVGSERQVFARIYIVCDSKEEYKKKIKDLEEQIVINDVFGNSLMINQLDIGQL